MKLRVLVIPVLIALIPFLVSCRHNQYKVDISSISEHVKIQRLDKDLFDADPEKIPSMVPGLINEYGTFLQLFSNVIHAGDVRDSTFSDMLVAFCTDKINNEVYMEVRKQFPDVSRLEKELSEAFRHYRWYFPGKAVPVIYTCMAGFNSSIITSDSVIGIGLDRYLGRSCRFYSQLQIYNYISARMNPWNIVPDCVYAWAVTEWEYDSVGYSSDNVLSRMIHEGKLKYYQKCMQPEITDTLLFGFTPGQLKFCINNESRMWQYLLEHDLLFSTDQFVIRKLTSEAPFTSYFSSESPGRAAVWTGFRIVESYMQKNKEISLGELLKEKDFQAILKGARYNPQ